MGSEHKIYKKPNDVYTIAASKRLHKSLTEKGFDVEKSNSAFYPQNIPSHLNSHFIRGLFDGDGCITRYFRKKDGVPVVSVYIAGTYSLLTEVNQRIPEPVPSLPKDKGKKSSHRLILSSQKAKNFLEWIYQDSNGLRLDRKYQRYIDCLNKEGLFSLDSRKA
ncbi:hypothetical protein MiSe_44240 [Microseira wollei NIES-4236]|uniref:Homing endonuclease LAGLIDADG domain-containing protein n=1 Tax=Microseira wollei NIES-4236 TaxID=2530354 RepID=A0AAV3XB08_9CYAN|nr:hypothetical protein MiSe_44240 [Microseira wollei NIES-4236]